MLWRLPDYVGSAVLLLDHNNRNEKQYLLYHTLKLLNEYVVFDFTTWRPCKLLLYTTSSLESSLVFLQQRSEKGLKGQSCKVAIVLKKP